MLIKIKTFKRIIVLIFFVILSLQSISQTPYLDTLRNQLHRSTNIKEQIDLQIYLAHFLNEYSIDSTKYYAGNVIRMSKEIHDDSNLVYGYQKYAMAYYNTSADSIAIYLDSLLMVAERSNNYHAKTMYYQFKAIEYEQRNDYEQSIKYELITLERSKIEQDTNAILSVVTNFAMLYQRAMNTDKLLSIIEENRDYIYSPANDYSYYFLILLKGAALIEKGNYEEGIKCIHETLSPNNTKLTYNTNNDAFQALGYAYQKLGDMDSCKFYFDQTIKYSYSEGDTLINDLYYGKLVSYLLENNELNKAEKYVLVGLSHSRAEALPLFEAEALEQLIMLYKTKGEFEKALKYVDDYKQLKDSVQTAGLDFLLDKMLLANELENTQKNLSNLVAEQTNFKNLRFLKIISLLPLLIFVLYWFYLAFSLYKFSSTHKHSALNNFWQSKLPEIDVTNKFVLYNALIYALLVGVLGVLLFKQPVSEAIISILLSFILFYACANLYLFLKKKQPNYNNLTDLVLISTFILSFSILTAGGYQLLYFNHTPAAYLIFLLLNISSLLIAVTINLIVRYNLIMNKLIQNITDSFNLKLSQQKSQFSQIEAHKSTKSKTIILDNLSEKVSINPDNIVFISSDNIYQEIICFENNRITKTMVRNTMSNIAKMLEDYPNFFKCHRSYIVNTNLIEGMQGSTQKCYFKIKHTNEKIPVSRTAAKEFSLAETSLMN